MEEIAFKTKRTVYYGRIERGELRRLVKDKVPKNKLNYVCDSLKAETFIKPKAGGDNELKK